MGMESEGSHGCNLLIWCTDCSERVRTDSRWIFEGLTIVSEFRDGVFLCQIPHLDNVECRSTAHRVSQDSRTRGRELTLRKSERARGRRAEPFHLDALGPFVLAPSIEYPKDRLLPPNYEHRL